MLVFEYEEEDVECLVNNYKRMSLLLVEDQRV
jgi:hypothetical protein